MKAMLYLCLWLLIASLDSAVAATPRSGTAPPAGVGGALSLRDLQGRRFDLRQLGDEPALLFFGFVGCGSTCPLALANARQLLRDSTLTPPTILFVTLDPLGDTPARLRQYLAAFDARIVGLTGTTEQLSTVLDRYGVAVQSNSGDVAHSSMWYLVNRRGEVLRVYSHTTPAQALAADLRNYRTRSSPP